MNADRAVSPSPIDAALSAGNSPDAVLILQHAGESDPGNLPAWLRRNGYQAETIQVATGMPDTHDFRAVIVLGSPAAVYDADQAWIGHEREFVRACVESGTPVLGICFGAQLLAEVLGGEVRPLRTAQLGWHSFRGDETYGGTWFSWHGDHIVPPTNATVLASSDRCVQAFRMGPHVGLQYHPEITPARIALWLSQPDRRQRLRNHGLSPELTVNATEDNMAEALRRAARLYDDFFSRSSMPFGSSVHHAHDAVE